jgi:hypothetical protein
VGELALHQTVEPRPALPGLHPYSASWKRGGTQRRRLTRSGGLRIYGNPTGGRVLAGHHAVNQTTVRKRQTESQNRLPPDFVPKGTPRPPLPGSRQLPPPPVLWAFPTVLQPVLKGHQGCQHIAAGILTSPCLQQHDARSTSHAQYRRAAVERWAGATTDLRSCSAAALSSNRE